MNKLKITILSLAYMVLATKNAFADRAGVGGVSGLDPGERFGGGGGSITINLILNRFLDFGLGSAAAVFALIFVWGAFTWLTSQGDKAALESAKAKITSGIVGLVIVAASYGIYLIVKEITFSSIPAGTP